MTEPRQTERIAFFDMLRGFTVISMVAFHAAYDAAYIYGYALPWFHGTLFQDIWRASISWTFLALAGWMTSLSRSNVKRACLYAGAALAVWVVTTVASVDTPISFGILFCMAASTAIYSVLQPLLKRLNPFFGTLLFLVLFGLTLNVPKADYSFDGLAWLGMPGPHFASGDYYPIVPFTFMYLAGSMGVRAFKRLCPQGYPTWMYRNAVPALSWVGTKSLIIYLAHQPLLILLFEAIALLR